MYAFDVLPYYSSSRISISLKTKSASAAIRASKSINQRVEDYWLGLRLQNMDIPAIQVVKSSDLSEAAILDATIDRNISTLSSTPSFYYPKISASLPNKHISMIASVHSHLL